MRVSMLFLSYFAFFGGSASAGDWYGIRGPGLEVMKTPAFGTREASAQLAVMLQDATDVENHLVTSALHFQVAIASGCSDLDIIAAQAVSRLSPEELALYQQDLPHWLPATGSAPDRLRGPCLNW
jgi:hypothetical protein